MSLRRSLIAALLILTLGAAKAASNDWYEHRDFLCFWSAGQLVASGADPYDPALYQSRLAASGLSPEQAAFRCGSRWPFPPWTTLLLAPFGALPLALASTLWTALLIAAAGAGLLWSWTLARGERRRLPLYAVLVVASEPFLLAFEDGQFSPLILALVTGALLLMRGGRQRSAGAVLASIAIKPQLVVVTIPALLLRAASSGRMRLVIAALVAGAAVAALSILALPGSLDVLAQYPTRGAGVAGPVASVWDLAASVGLPLLAPALCLALGVLLVALSRGTTPDDATYGALAVAYSLAVAPYAWSYDYVLLALPWALTVGRLSDLTGGRRLLVLLLQVGIASPLAWGLFLLAFARGGETLSPILPASTALLCALAARWAQMRGRASGLNGVSG